MAAAESGPAAARVVKTELTLKINREVGKGLSIDFAKGRCDVLALIGGDAADAPWRKYLEWGQERGS